MHTLQPEGLKAVSQLQMGVQIKYAHTVNVVLRARARMNGCGSDVEVVHSEVAICIRMRIDSLVILMTVLCPVK